MKRKLTIRQRDALERIAMGLTIDQAAHDICVSRSTFEKILSAVKRKLNARSVANAIYIAVKAGILLVCVIATNLEEWDDFRNAKQETRIVRSKKLRSRKTDTD